MNHMSQEGAIHEVNFTLLRTNHLPKIWQLNISNKGGHDGVLHIELDSIGSIGIL